MKSTLRWSELTPYLLLSCLFAVAAHFGLWIIHVDAKAVFLNGNSDLVELYPEQREDSSEETKS
jgi:hypothetical protein